ncbi:MAG TPA: class III extradiol ring-cleavage dioxygenase, partial [Burkholderiales bacterium]|nr:class III extradiol ring-cleavage dioxygenase [Burkholderiales bacterium]
MPNRLATVFVSHGSPMHAIEAGSAGEAWRNIAAALPRPRAVLMVSAHWETDRPAVSSASRPETIHDFSGFPESLSRIRYPAPGVPAVARRIDELLGASDFTVDLDGDRGLDHGAWVPLSYMYPQADVPVLQLSVQPRSTPARHLALGRALHALTGEGVLLVGSGHMTHNLGDWMRDKPVPYVSEFRDWIHERIGHQDHESLVAYRSLAPHAVRAHPTEEHFLPLFVALGAAGMPYRPERAFDGMERGAL